MALLENLTVITSYLETSKKIRYILAQLRYLLTNWHIFKYQDLSNTNKTNIIHSEVSSLFP